MAKMSTKGMHDLGVKPEPMAKTSKDTAPQPSYPSMHIGHGAGVDLPEGEHHFHIKAKVSSTTHKKADGESSKSHELEVTHIKHLGSAGASETPKNDPSEALEGALDSIQSKKSAPAESGE